METNNSNIENTNAVSTSTEHFITLEGTPFSSMKDTPNLVLTGEENGETLYREQLKGKINFDLPFVIHMPSNVSFMSAFFMRGFFREIAIHIGVDQIGSWCRIEAPGFMTNLPDVNVYIYATIKNLLP